MVGAANTGHGSERALTSDPYRGRADGDDRGCAISSGCQPSHAPPRGAPGSLGLRSRDISAASATSAGRLPSWQTRRPAR